MRRRAPRAAGMSLFPFLAVLICTMGALVVLLVMALRHASLHGEAVASEQAQRQVEADAAQARLAEARDDYELRRELLEQSRAKTAEQLHEASGRLAHLEDHIRRLHDELRQMEQLADALQRQESATEAERQARAASLARLREEIDRRRQQVEATRRETTQRPKYYAILPYDGPQGTRRRPVYIECLADRVVLRPEGVTLSLDDFRPPLDPGNPLAAALRATREQLDRAAAGDGSGSRPYPLLLVRPDGAETYALARGAMKSWDSEFGYELIAADMQLAFPPSDPALAAVQQRAVNDARRRRQLLVEAAPSRYGRDTDEGNVMYRATSRGGFERVGRGDETGAPLGRPSSGRGTGADGDERHGTAGFGADSSIAGGHGAGTDPRTTARGMGPHAAQAGDDANQFGFNDPVANEGETHEATPGERAEGTRAPNGQSPVGRPRPGGGPGGPDGVSGGAASQFAQNLAASRGRNWGLPGGVAPTAYRRAIGLHCLADRLVLIPEPGDPRGPVAIPWEANPVKTVDALVAAIARRTESWGLAGVNAYWKPLLETRVAPDGEARFRDLQTLLDDSGIDLARAKP